jgi:hypothetical protein
MEQLQDLYDRWVYFFFCIFGAKHNARQRELSASHFLAKFTQPPTTATLTQPFTRCSIEPFHRFCFHIQAQRWIWMGWSAAAYHLKPRTLPPCWESTLIGRCYSDFCIFLVGSEYAINIFLSSLAVPLYIWHETRHLLVWEPGTQVCLWLPSVPCLLWAFFVRCSQGALRYPALKWLPFHFMWGAIFAAYVALYSFLTERQVSPSVCQLWLQQYQQKLSHNFTICVYSSFRVHKWLCRHDFWMLVAFLASLGCWWHS